MAAHAPAPRLHVAIGPFDWWHFIFWLHQTLVVRGLGAQGLIRGFALLSETRET